jgi:hypothetical protein
MRARSWMAALALVLGSSVLVAQQVTAWGARPTQEKREARDESRKSTTPSTEPTASGAKTTTGVIPSVQLNLVIAGLGRAGCDVEIKPGNASCRFRSMGEKGPVDRYHVAPEGKATMELRDVELRGADRTCTVAITLHEPGQGPKTVYRGFRLPTRSPNDQASARETVPVFTCYMSSPSKLARTADSHTRTRK